MVTGFSRFFKIFQKGSMNKIHIYCENKYSEQQGKLDDFRMRCNAAEIEARKCVLMPTMKKCTENQFVVVNYLA